MIADINTYYYVYLYKTMYDCKLIYVFVILLICIVPTWFNINEHINDGRMIACTNFFDVPMYSSGRTIRRTRVSSSKYVSSSCVMLYRYCIGKRDTRSISD